MNTPATSWNLALLACVFFHFGQLDTLANNDDYQSVKSDIELYAKADDMMDELLLLARSRFRGLPATSVTHLLRLVEENEEDNYREAVVDAFEHNRASYDTSVPFILRQLQAPASEWKGKIWIARSMDFLWKANQESAVLIAKKAVESRDDFIRSKALKLLEIGTTAPSSVVKVPVVDAPPKTAVQPPTPQKAPETKLILPPSEEPQSSTPWSIIDVLIVAATGLLWLLVKKRE